MNDRDLPQIPPQKRTSLQRGTPNITEGIYPADTSRKDTDLQTGHQDAAAAAISPYAQPHSTEAPLFVLTILGYPHPPKHNYCWNNILRNKKPSTIS
jgi:hypothetical protein